VRVTTVLGKNLHTPLPAALYQSLLVVLDISVILRSNIINVLAVLLLSLLGPLALHVRNLRNRAQILSQTVAQLASIYIPARPLTAIAM
jgi:hypothetical protein